MTSSVVKAVRAEVDRLARAGSERLKRCSREMARKDPDKGKRITISSKLEAALLEELRARAALALLEGRRPEELPPDSLDGVKCVGIQVAVDQEQFEDCWPTSRERPRASEPRESGW